MFFPKHVTTLQEDRYEKKIEIDVSEPIVMSYIFSRPDNIIIQLDLPSTAPEIETKDTLITEPFDTNPDSYEPQSNYIDIWDNPSHVLTNSNHRKEIPNASNIRPQSIQEGSYSRADERIKHQWLHTRLLPASCEARQSNAPVQSRVRCILSRYPPTRSWLMEHTETRPL